MIAYISIGNTDNKLTQQDWAQFCAEVSQFVNKNYFTIFGEWYSLPNSPYQNACWAINVTSPENLEMVLADFAWRYKQDSIAVAYAPDTVFVKSSGPQGEM